MLFGVRCVWWLHNRRSQTVTRLRKALAVESFALTIAATAKTSYNQSQHLASRMFIRSDLSVGELGCLRSHLFKEVYVVAASESQTERRLHPAPESSHLPAQDQDMVPSTLPRVAPTSTPESTQRTRLILVLSCLAVLLTAPYLVGRIQYQATYNKLLAGVDVATDGLLEVKPRLEDFMLASRLVATRVGPSVVSILRPELPGTVRSIGQGSGVIVDKDGFVLTNYHVVERAGNLQVRLSDGRQSTATVVGADPATDVAVLKLKPGLAGLIEAEWGDSDELAVGDLVWALGSPFGLDRSITFGIVSAKERRAASSILTNSSVYQEYLQTDAAVNPGNSGGPLVDVEGRIVGINTAIVGHSYQGISFAIPSSLAREKYEQLREKGWIERGFLGIQPERVTQNSQQKLNLQRGEGVFVGSVEKGSPAERAGLRQGDVILRWNDHVASDPTLLSRAIAATKIGSTATVVIVRGGVFGVGTGAAAQRQELQVVVGRRDDRRVR